VKRKLFLALLCLVAMIGLCGCGLVSHTSLNQGTEITDEQLAKIHPGMTKEDVLIALGEPTRVNDVEGHKVWLYCWQRGGRTSVFWGTVGSDSAKSYCATVIFDKNGKVLRTGKGRAGSAQLTPVFTIRKEEVGKEQQKNQQNW